MFIRLEDKSTYSLVEKMSSLCFERHSPSLYSDHRMVTIQVFFKR